MKRKVLSALAVLAMSTFVFTACNNDDSTPATTTAPATTPEATTQAEEVQTTTAATQTMSSIERGTWENDVWSSDYLGISFTLPTGWIVATDAELADNLDLGMDFFDLDINLSDFHLLPDMGAYNPETGDNVQVMIERLLPEAENFTAAEYAQMTAIGIQMFGGEVSFDGPSVMLGGYEWYTIDTLIDFGMLSAAGRQLINIQDGFARLIIITHHITDEDSVSSIMDEILSHFN